MANIRREAKVYGYLRVWNWAYSLLGGGPRGARALWSKGVQRERDASLGHGRCRKEQERSSDWRVSGAITLTSGVQGDAVIPLIVGCREIEISRSWSIGETIAGAGRLNA
jgi:hypothetical protein